jgi:hypothetical protein
MSNALNIVQARLKSLSTKPARLDKQINLYRLHLRVPIVRQPMKPTYSFVSGSRTHTLELWNEVWNLSKLFEAKVISKVTEENPK